MSWHIKVLNDLLSESDTIILKNIWEPVVVAVPPSDAWKFLCIASDGEIRCYGSNNKKNHRENGEPVYIASLDCGLSWKKYISVKQTEIGPSVRSPYSGRYIRLQTESNNTGSGKGTYALISEGGPGFDIIKRNKVTDENMGNTFLPIPLIARKRWIGLGVIAVDGENHPAVAYSDDDGETWKHTVLESAPRHDVKWPHEGERWYKGATINPTVAELGDGTLMLIARTNQDHHYLYYSYDGGETWTLPVASRFHATLTMPKLMRLSDGRILFFWCNTQPLPEVDHKKYWPPLDIGVITGKNEDVFTNRDVNHAAISDDDGKTWKGFREIFLNTIRNDSDFRTKGANFDSLDKSVHQFEALELPFGKVLLSFGQHPVSRKIVIFDPSWLYETGRSENFMYGLGNLSTQVYLKSVSGNFHGFSGHCAWNRTNGAVMMPDPEGNYEEALHISRINDERLFSEVQGAVWNFPAAKKGELRIKMRIDGEGVRISLTDRWFNPIDWTVKELAQLSFSVTGEMLKSGTWSILRVLWDIRKEKAEIFIDDGKISEIGIREDIPDGFSYLHIQSLAKEADFKGTLVKSLEQFSS